MHELVRDGKAEHRSLGALDTIEGGGVGIVVAGDLLGEHVLHDGAEVERIGEETEEGVGPGELEESLGRHFLRELGADKVSYFVAGAEDGLGAALELDADTLLDGGHEAVDQVCEVPVGVGLPRLAATGHRRDEQQAERCAHQAFR